MTKMKKNYFSPEFEVIEVKLQSHLLEASGGGIKDNGEANTGQGGSENPGEDYGW